VVGWEGPVEGVIRIWGTQKKRILFSIKTEG